MRILAVLLDPRFGGIPKRVAIVSSGLMEKGIHISAVVPNGSNEARDLLISAGIPTKALTYGLLIPTKLDLTRRDMVMWFFDSLVFPARLVNEIKRQQADIVHVNGLYGSRAVIAAKIAGKRIVWHLVSTNYPKFVVWLWRIFLSRAADITIFVSRTASRFYTGSRQLRQSERIIFEAVDVHEFSRDGIAQKEIENLRSELRIGESDRIILFVGNLNRAKGVEILIEAFSSLAKDYPSVVLVISGQAIASQIGYRESLEKKVTSLNMGNRVKFVGRYPNLKVLLAASEVLVAPSFAEGTPAVIMEAMSMGIPVVATTVGGIPDMVDDGETGLLVPPGDPIALNDAIRTILSDSETRESMGERGRAVVVGKFAKNICIEKHFEVYQELANSDVGAQGNHSSTR